MESGARLSVLVVNIDELTDEGYMALDTELQVELEALLG